jgi:hypothetical protein
MVLFFARTRGMLGSNFGQDTDFPYLGIPGCYLSLQGDPTILSIWCYWQRRNITSKKQEVPGRTNRLLSLIRHWPQWPRRVQQFLYCCVCIRYRGNVSTERLPSDNGIFTEPLPSNDRGSFTEPLPSNDRGVTHTHIQRQQRDLISLLHFSK